MNKAYDWTLNTPLDQARAVTKRFSNAAEVMLGTGAGADALDLDTMRDACLTEYAAGIVAQIDYMNAIRAYLADGVLNIGTITVSAGDATKFKTTTIAAYTLAGVTYTKAATDALVFTTAGTINVAGAATTAHWGAWVVQINAAGSITTRAVGGGTTDQDYATEALAKAAAIALGAAADNQQIGIITVQGLASTSWVAATSNLTVGGGAGNCTARNFYDLPAVKTLPAAI